MIPSNPLRLRIGSPQWHQQLESWRSAAKMLDDKLKDDRHYVADPASRADDAAKLHFAKDRVRTFELEDELSKNPSPERVAEIKKELDTLQQTEGGDFAFLQRLGQQANQRFEQSRKLHEAERTAIPQQPTPASQREREPELNTETLEEAVKRILNNPAAYPLMSYEQVALALQVTKRTVGRYCERGKLQGTVVGKVRTDSVKALLGSSRIERDSQK